MTHPFVGAFIGSRPLLIRCCEVFRQLGHEPRVVITDDLDVEQWAAANNITTLPTATADLARQLLSVEPSIDYLFSVVHLAILPPEVLRVPTKGAINFHDGPLPAYAGLNTPSWAILNQETEHGITWHEMETEVDVGRILKQQTFPIRADDTALDLNAKCFDAGVAMFGELVDDLSNGTLIPVPQDTRQRTYYGKRQRPKGLGTLPLHTNCQTVKAIVRALSFGGYANPLTCPKIWFDNTPYVVTGADQVAADHAPPATIVGIKENELVVTTSDGALELSLSTLSGQPLAAAEILDRHQLAVGQPLGRPSEEQLADLTRLGGQLAHQEIAWLPRLKQAEHAEVPYVRRNKTTGELVHCGSDRAGVNLASSCSLDSTAGDITLFAFAAYLARLGRKRQITIPLHHELAFQGMGASEASVCSLWTPFNLGLSPQDSFVEFVRRAEKELQSCIADRSFCFDLIPRSPELNEMFASKTIHDVVVYREVAGTDKPTGNGCLYVTIRHDGSVDWHYDPQAITKEHVLRMQEQFSHFCDQLGASHGPVCQVGIVSPAEAEKIREQWNQTSVDYDRSLTVHEAFQRQAEAAPNKIALVYGERSLTYSELNRRSDDFARHLASLGVKRGDCVGVMMDRTDDMIVAMIAILKTGAAYVPLDPAYPQKRLEFMIEDAAVACVVTQPSLLNSPESVSTTSPDEASVVADAACRFVTLADAAATSAAKTTLARADARDLAYLIYTSGSTGKPKGVMVEHGNVINFFSGMDERIEFDDTSALLCVTSISFDISVLEIFWSLSRGLKLVLYGGHEDEVAKPAVGRSPTTQTEPHSMGFSLSYFASDESQQDAGKYDLLLQGAKFADENGFEAIWTPERHFHAFGGLFPNPTVTSAALAAITTRVGIRAGSCVLPLHHPIRVAEEWSVVDNISHGRVGVSFASGWQPTDFVLNPDTYQDRRESCYREIETVRSLWRGNAVTFPGPLGDEEVTTLPRPIQPELPIWITAAGSPETFRTAGELGANMLTHLLGQSVEELREKIAVYRQARQNAGHDRPGQVTLMLHTFVCDDEAFARSQVRAPLKGYLRSATSLLKDYAHSFPAFKGVKREGVDEAFKELSDEDLEALLEHAFERYYESSGLFGTVDRALEMVQSVADVGVDEIACLIDFGIDGSMVLDHLADLNELRQAAESTIRGPAVISASSPSEGSSVGFLLRRHHITHLQCTPSMARLLLQDESARTGMAELDCLMVGGEAMSTELARELTEQVSGSLINMYGPTETTIWSSTHPVTEATGSISIGRPIANTQIHIVDENGQPLPIGVAGELLIGGAGVTRGYLNRKELTARAFISDPHDLTTKLYRTGDLARWAEDGTLDFLGRLDTQVKLRGYRMELGEIEAAIGQHPDIREAVVTIREDNGERRLIGYFVPQGDGPNVTALKDFLGRDLPSFMIPAAFVSMVAFPLTPNKKVDKKRLPAPNVSRPNLATEYVAPRNANEELLAGFFAETLSIDKVGVFDSFIELGGDSLSAVDLFSRIKSQFFVDFPLHALLQNPTVASLVQELERLQEAPASEENGEPDLADWVQLIQREELI